MAKFVTLKCDNCGLILKPQWGHDYVTNNAGNRIVLPHPAGWRSEVAAKILIDVDGYKPEYFESAEGESLLQDRLGMYTPMICLTCAEQFYLDHDKDPHVCQKCKSADVTKVEDDMECPACNKGHLIKHGRTMMT